MAGRRVETDRAVAELAAFAVPRRPTPGAAERLRSRVPDDDFPSAEGEPAAAGETVYRAPAWIGDRMRATACRSGLDGFHLEIEGAGRFFVSADGGEARVLALEPGAPEGLMVEVALGPLLILALALGGVFCLHASAVALDAGTPAQRAIAFLGPSGSGKSTLAATLAAAGGAFRRLADDVLPVRPAPGQGYDALPRFPQLKLPPERQPAAGAPERLPLAALFVLAPSDGSRAGAGPVRAEALSRREAALALIRHTTAARVFAPALLERHLDAAALLARRLPVRRLAYPWLGGPVPGLAEALLAGLEAA